MKRYHFILFLLVICTLPSFAQNEFLDGVYLSSDEELIKEINQQKELIDKKMSAYHKVEKVRDSLGYRNAYFDGKELKLVIVFYRENNLDKTKHWYFQKGKLVYGESTISAIGYGSQKDEKLYLDNEHLFWWTIGGIPVDRNSVMFKKSANELGYYSLQLIMENKE
ncbi:MAG: hypothetical protein ABI763_05475 [Bacteroidota bacterium]